MPSSNFGVPRLRIETDALNEPPPTIVVEEERLTESLSVPVAHSPVSYTPKSPRSSSSFLRPRPSANAPSGKGGVHFLLQDVLRKLRQRPKVPFTLTADDVHFDTEVAFTLVSHLYEVLRTADTLRPGAPASPEKPSKATFSKKLRRATLHKKPSVEVFNSDGPDIFLSIADILSELILVDCRFQLEDYGPARPPLALQLMVINVAKLLVQKYVNNASRLRTITTFMLPTLTIFPARVLPHLAYFFQDDVLGAVQDLLSGPPPGLLSSFIVPLLDCLNSIGDQDLSCSMVCRLIRRIIDMKPDVHLDLLEIIASHEGVPRRMGICLLMEIWPKTVSPGRGHFPEARAMRRGFSASPINPTAMEFSWELCSEDLLLSVLSGCLTDTDVAVNEFGLVVAQRAWQSHARSDYGVQGLTVAVVSWILKEPDVVMAPPLSHESLSRATLIQLHGVPLIRDSVPTDIVYGLCCEHAIAGQSEGIVANIIRWHDETGLEIDGLLERLLLDDALAGDAMPSIRRLFPSRSKSTADGVDLTTTTFDLTLDSWLVFDQLTSVMGIDTAIRWLTTFSLAGVTVPADICSQILSSISAFGIDAHHWSMFARVLFRSALSPYAERHHLQQPIVYMLTTSHQYRQLDPTGELTSLLLAALLALAGHDGHAHFSGLVGMENSFGVDVGTVSKAAIQLDEGILSMLVSLIELGPPSSTLVLHFLKGLLCDISREGPHHIDIWAAGHSSQLTDCAWKLCLLHDSSVDLQHAVLTRIVTIDGGSFRQILDDLSTCTDWPLRLQAFSTLAPLVFDAATIELPDALRFCLTCLWDPQDEIRLAASSLASLLQPHHRDLMLLLWSERLLNQPVVEKIRVLSLLIQLSPFLQTMSWQTISSLLEEIDFNASPETSSMEHRLHTSACLLVLEALTFLPLLDADILPAFKFSLARLIGFADAVRLRGLHTVTEHAIACIDGLPTVLDSSLITDFDTEDGSIHVGTPFIDVVLAIFVEIADLECLPATTLRNLTEALLIIMRKHVLNRGQQDNLKQALSRLRILFSRSTPADLVNVAVAAWRVSSSAADSQLVFHSSSSLHVEYMEAMLQLIGSCTRKEDAAYGEVKAFLNVMTQRYSSTLLDIMKGPEHTKLLEGLAHVIAADSGSYRNDVLAAISGRLFSGSEIDLMADISSYLAVLQRLVDSDPRPFPRDILLWLFALTEDGPPALLPVDLGRLLAVCLALSGHLSGQNKFKALPGKALFVSVDGVTERTILETALDLELQGKTSDPNPSAVISQLTWAHLRRVVELIPEAFASILAVRDHPALSIVVSDPETVIADGLSYLQETDTAELETSMTIARWVLNATRDPPSLLNRLQLWDLTNDVRWWNVFLLAALKEGPSVARLLLHAYPYFLPQEGSVLRRRTRMGDVSPSVIKHFAIAAKLWLLLVEHAMWHADMNVSDKIQAAHSASRIWWDVWDDFEAAYESLVAGFWDVGDRASRSLWRTTIESVRVFVHQSPFAHLVLQEEFEHSSQYMTPCTEKSYPSLRQRIQQVEAEQKAEDAFVEAENRLRQMAIEQD